MTTSSPWLARLPAGLFAIPFGLFALAGAWRRSAVFGWTAAPQISAVLGLLALTLLFVLLVLYAAKLLRHRAAVQMESQHPLGGPTQALLPLALLMCVVYYGHASQSGWLLLVLLALALQCVIALRIVGRLARGSLDPQTVTPALYLPPVAGGFVGTLASTSAKLKPLLAALDAGTAFDEAFAKAFRAAPPQAFDAWAAKQAGRKPPGR